MAEPDQRGVALLPIAALFAGMVSIQLGASLAKSLFAEVGAAGITALRVSLSALILVAVWRPWRRHLARADAGAIMLYGCALGAMNLLFYQSLRTVPLGIAVAIEFVGPLTVALLASRRPRDFAWIGLAVAGLALLLPIHGGETIDPIGAAYAFGAGCCWGLYIVFGQRAARVDGGQAVSLGMSMAAIFVAPFGLVDAGTRLLEPGILLAGLLVAILSSALPYSLEMYGLRHLPRQVFGVMMSLEPAIASLAAFVVLGERIGPIQGVAIGCVIAASAGITVGSRRRLPTAHD